MGGVITADAAPAFSCSAANDELNRTDQHDQQRPHNRFNHQISPKVTFGCHQNLARCSSSGSPGRARRPNPSQILGKNALSAPLQWARNGQADGFTRPPRPDHAGGLTRTCRRPRSSSMSCPGDSIGSRRATASRGVGHNGRARRGTGGRRPTGAASPRCGFFSSWGGR